MIKALKFISIPVRDQQAALEFYTQKLGLTVFTDQPFDDHQRWIELTIPGAQTRVVLFTPQGHEDRVGSFVNGAFGADNIERTAEEFRAKGVEIVDGPKKTEWGSYVLIKDCEGNVLCISSN